MDVTDFSDPKVLEFTIEDLILDYDDIYIEKLENLGPLNPIIDPIKKDIKAKIHDRITSNIIF